MTGIRWFTEDDAPRVAALHGRVFFRDRFSGGVLPAGADAYYRDAVLSNPWRTEGIGPLVYEDAVGRIIGFVGVIPRPMAMADRPICAAVLSSFMVDPEYGSPVVAASMLKRAVRGGQDLTFGNGANDSMRALWQASGRGVVPHLSMRWWRLLRPVGFAGDWLGGGRGRFERAVGAALQRVSPIVDTAAVAMRRSRSRRPFGASGRPLATRVLSGADLVECLERFGRRRPVRPLYTADQLEWLLRYLAIAGGDELRPVGVVENGGLAGWFVGRLVGSVMQILQLGAFEGRAHDVLATAAASAHAAGAASMQGRVDAALLGDLWDAGCVVKRGPWFLVDSADADLLREIYSGRALITSLETASLPLDW